MRLVLSVVVGVMTLAVTPRAEGLGSTCSVGRYVVQGKRLFAGAPEETVITLTGDAVSIPGVCPPTAVRLEHAARRTKVTATWEQCEAVSGPVRLRGAIEAVGCRTFAGRIRMKRAVRRRFRAKRFLGDPESCARDSTFDQIQRRILGPRGCRVETCHGVGRAGGLDLRAGVSHLGLVGTPATNAAAAAAGKLRVVPGDPEASFLWQKLTGRLAVDEGGHMPQVGRALDALELDLVRAWIEDGAAASGTVAGAPCLPREEYQPAPALAPPSGGHQIVFEGPVLAPGEEVEGCTWVQVPNTADFVVGKWEYSLNPGTHHFALWDHSHGDPPELNVFKRQTACIASGARPDGVTVSGAGEAPYFVDGYPAGIGKIVKGGSLLGLNPHYHNDFDVPVQMKIWINLHPVSGELRHLAETLISTAASLDGQSPYSILVPPFTTATLRLRYTNHSDRPWKIFELSSHQHKRGTRFTAWRSDGTKVFENLDWAHPAILDFDPPLILPPGDYIEYECEHDNGVTRAVRRCGDSVHDGACTPGDPVPVTFGITAQDEMCFLTGFYYTE